MPKRCGTTSFLPRASCAPGVKPPGRIAGDPGFPSLTATSHLRDPDRSCARSCQGRRPFQAGASHAKNRRPVSSPCIRPQWKPLHRPLITPCDTLNLLGSPPRPCPVHISSASSVFLDPSPVFRTLSEQRLLQPFGITAPKAPLLPRAKDRRLCRSRTRTRRSLSER